MFVAMILVCGLPAGNMGCQALVNAIPMDTSAECYDNIANNIPAIVDSLPYGALVVDFECVPMSIAG